LTGLDVAPGAGDKFYVVDTIAKARELADQRKHTGLVQKVGGRSVETSLEDFQMLLESGKLSKGTGDIVTLNLIIRADVKGSIEAIQKELGKISHPEVEIKILQALAGGVSDYDVIYKITDDLKATLEGRLKPEEQVVESGMAMVLRTFSISKTGTIAGCRVMRGSIQRECRMRVIRDQTVIGDYAIDSLKREKDDAKEVARGMECGIKLETIRSRKSLGHYSAVNRFTETTNWMLVTLRDSRFSKRPRHFTNRKTTSPFTMPNRASADYSFLQSFRLSP